MKFFPIIALLAILGVSEAAAQSPYQSSAEFAKYAMRLREESLLQLEPQVIIPTNAGQPRYPWHDGINTTIFWVGEAPSQNNPVHNYSSSWDREWWRSFGGYDNPDVKARRKLNEGGSIPAGFTPLQNPFYFALPYNDVSGGYHKADTDKIIPWFKQAYTERGKSVLRDRWIAIRRGRKVCYAQWADCGPFTTEHWEYVFGRNINGKVVCERPRLNLNQGAGLDVSPAVRDYLEIGNLAAVDWRFVEVDEVPEGPWAYYGDNNTAKKSLLRMAQNTKSTPGPKERPATPPARTPVASSDLPLPKKDEGGPVVIIR